MEEAAEHPHNVARGTFINNAGMTQAGPAPRFSRTGAEVAGPAAHAGQHTDDVLGGFGFSPDQITDLRSSGAVA
jgi:alpha-methylacyl-CoA racemase